MVSLTKKSKIFLTGAIFAAVVFLAAVVMTIVSAVKSNEKMDLGFDVDSYNVVKMAKTEEGYIAGTQRGEVFSFDVGGELWNVGALDTGAVYEIALGDGKAYVVYENGNIYSFSLSDAEEFDPDSGEKFSEKCTKYSLGYNISGKVANTQLLTDGGGGFYLRAKCNDGQNRNYIFHFEEGGSPERVRRSAGNFLLGGMTVQNGAFYYIYQNGLYTGAGECLFERDENLIALSSSEDELYMLTAGGSLIVRDAAGEATEYPLPVAVDTANALSTGENFLVKIKNGGAALIDVSERAVSFTMPASNDANFIFWTDDAFALRDTSDINNPVVLFYSGSLAHSVSLFGKLVWVFLAVALVSAAAAVICAFCIFGSTREKFVAGTVRAAKSIWRNKSIYLALLVPFALLITFFYVPIVLGFSISFMDYIPGEKAVFEGFKYFKMELINPDFWEATGTMLLFLLADLLKALIPPFIIAELMITVRLKRFSLWVRILLFLPGVLPGVAATLVWQEGIFGTTTNALVNAFVKLFVPNFAGMNWIFNPRYEIRVLSIVCFGFPWVGSYLIFFGALGGINTSIFEAAKLDGCSWFKRVFTIDIPLILSQFKYVLITTFIASVQNYGTLYILYGTGSGDTLRTPALMMYSEILSGNYNLASVMGVFLFLFLAVVTVLNFRSQREQID